MSEEKKYKLIVFILLAVILVTISIVLYYLSYYKITSVSNQDNNYVSLAFSGITWLGFVGCLAQLLTIADNDI
mgnify:CR=1 FL=1